MSVIGHLEISSYRGISIGAVHYYGRIRLQHRDDLDSYKDPIELQRPIDTKEAIVMNKEFRESKGADYDRYYAGMLTNGFWQPVDVITNRIEYFKTKYPDGILMSRSSAEWSAWKEVLYYPKQFKKIAEKMNKLSIKFREIDGYEGDEKEATRIDKKWEALYIQLRADILNI